MFGELTGGVIDGIRGASFLVRHPRLWIWVALPAVIIGLLVWALIGALLTFGHRLTGHIPWHWAEHLLQAVLGILLAIASVSLILSMAALIAGPFNEILSEAIEEQVTGVPSPKFKLGHFLHDLAVGAIHAIRRIVVYLLTMGVLLLIGLVVPVAGTLVTAIGGWLATARFASYDAYDAVYSRQRLSYRAKLASLDRHIWRTMGLGAVMALAMIVPGLNLLALSIGAAGATLRMVTPAPAPALQRATRS